MSKITPKDKNFVECMFNDLDDIHGGSDEQVKKELIDMGIDINQAQKGFQATLARCQNMRKRQRLEVAREQRLADAGRVSNFLDMVRRKALTVSELISRISELQPAMAHREFNTWSKEDLESQLADLLALQQGGTEEDE